MMPTYQMMLVLLLISCTHYGTTTTTIMSALSTTPSTAGGSTATTGAGAPTTTTTASSTTIHPIINVTISIYSATTLAPANCSKSCSIGGTVAIPVQCKIKGSGIDKDCNAGNFNATTCDYVVVRNRHYVCDEVKKNYTGIVLSDDKVEALCKFLCPVDTASGIFLPFWLVLLSVFLSSGSH